jgi:beta-lactamase class A
VDRGELQLDQTVKVETTDFVRKGMYSPIRDKYPQGAQFTIAELLRYAVAESDGTASDVLLKLTGGARGVMLFLNDINVSGVNVVNSEKEIGRDWQTQYQNWATPKAAVELLAALQTAHGLSAESQAFLLKLTTESIPGAKRLKGQLPAGTVVAHKTGTGGTRDGITSATNDIGIITLPNGTHLAVAVFVSDSSGDEATRESVIARIAKAAWDWASSVQQPDRKQNKDQTIQPGQKRFERKPAHSVPDYSQVYGTKKSFSVYGSFTTDPDAKPVTSTYFPSSGV